jgi:hypothetical protein
MSRKRILFYHSFSMVGYDIGDLFENLSRNMHYPILRSDLRSAKDNTELTMVKIHAQLLEV